MIKEGLQFNKTITLETIICCECGIPFAVPDDYRQSLMQTKDSFYCPNGHGQHYSKSPHQVEKEKWDKERELYQRDLEILNNQISEQRKLRRKAENRLKRVHKGVCPCCNRTFQNLSRHIKTKHPELIDKKQS